MSKPTAVFTRPWDWVRGGYTSEKLNLIYAPMAGNAQPKRRNGKPAGDGVGEVATREGIMNLWKIFEEHKPEVFLYWVHYGFDTDVFERLKLISPKTIFICGYGNQPHEVCAHVRKFKKYIDVILLNSKDPRNYQMYYDFGLRKVGTLCDGFDPQEWVPRNIPREFDCFFGGNQALYAGNLSERAHGSATPIMHNGRGFIFPNGPIRYDLLIRLNKTFNLRVHGNAGKLPFPTKPYLFYPNYAPEFQKARTVIGCPHYDLQQYYTRRTIHSGASGRPFITKYIPGMEEDFGESGKYLLWFNTIDEAVEQVRWCLDHEREADEMGQRCRELFLEKHSWQARLREFESFVLELVG